MQESGAAKKNRRVKYSGGSSYDKAVGAESSVAALYTHTAVWLIGGISCPPTILPAS
jgi:hypothetical protein